VLTTPLVVGDEEASSMLLFGDVKLAPLDRDETGAQPMEEISSSGVVTTAGVKWNWPSLSSSEEFWCCLAATSDSPEDPDPSELFLVITGSSMSGKLLDGLQLGPSVFLGQVDTSVVVDTHRDRMSKTGYVISGRCVSKSTIPSSSRRVEQDEAQWPLVPENLQTTKAVAVVNVGSRAEARVT
jgi:hypothetical protein